MGWFDPDQGEQKHNPELKDNNLCRTHQTTNLMDPNFDKVGLGRRAGDKLSDYSEIWGKLNWDIQSFHF